MSEVVQSVKWCSLFCTGNEAIGELSFGFEEGKMIDVPICGECLAEVQKNQQEALARILGT